jgi:D-beta-D-heptose 7-phosphate kinase / D-beta-D-heptose 1-phosphate adenosyltransferase
MKIGFCNGCWDILHEGHLHFLQQCRARCDYLVVAVNSDKSIRRLKGADRPIYPLEHRLAELQSRAGAYADALVPFEGFEEPLIVSIHPAVVFRGHDQSVHAYPISCEVIRATHLPGHSTSLQIAASRGKRARQ